MNRLPMFMVKPREFEKSDFVEMPTKWFFFTDPKDKNLFFSVKIGELKDGRTYLGALMGRIDGKRTREDDAKLMKSLTDFLQTVAKKFKTRVLLSIPPEEWMLEDLPTEWKKAIKIKEQEFKERISYIG